MKTMDYKKKYKDALERAQKELQTCGSTDCDAAKQIFRFFPELRESEDERIRKSIISLIQNGGYMSSEDKGKAISWLEKQDPKKPAWSEEDETALYDALWCCKQAARIAKDENDMGNIWYAENWLKSIKDRMKGE